MEHNRYNTCMKVLIVGGGFGGVRAALNLAGQADFDVTLVSKIDYFEYHAALYRSATGRSPFEAVITLTDFFAQYDNVQVVCDEVTKLDPKTKTVKAASGSSYHYDVLILALGVVTQYFGIEGLDKYSYGIKTMQEALEFKRHLHEDLVNGKQAEYNYTVIGGGPTGIELTAELTTYVEHIRKCHKIKRPFNIDLIEAADRLLPNMPKRYGRLVTGRLQQLGVRLFLNTKVKAEKAGRIAFPHGHLDTHTVAWTAGVANNPFYAAQGELFKFGHNGKIEVNKHLEALPHVYVIGDGANTKYSGMAQTAIHDASFVTNNLRRRLNHQPPLKYRDKQPIYAVPVGPYWAAVKWGWFETYGLAGWGLRRLADLNLWLEFLKPRRAVSTWEQGFETSEGCKSCS